MYDNIDKKLKVLSKIVMILGFSIFGFLVFMGLIGGIAQLFFLSLLGMFLSWFLGICLYGFGQLIENTNKIVKALNNEKKKLF